MSWGIKPPDERMWWGARAIYQNDYFIDLVWDRQEMIGGEPPDRKKFETWLNKKGIPKLRTLVKKMGLGTADEDTVAVDCDGYHLEASPRRSYGYLYLGAWKEQP